MKIDEITCWKGYRKDGTKKGKGGKRVNNCVKEIYKQKDGDYARDSDPAPANKKSGQHPLGGKLVG